ncbi:MAG: hypothetical protein LQ346_003586 [Caloplaca aetnensis]|nr:MAG: hypothetical protein LQ346_003586 [Caloplaca aetnensis]
MPESPELTEPRSEGRLRRDRRQVARNNARQEPESMSTKEIQQCHNPTGGSDMTKAKGGDSDEEKEGTGMVLPIRTKKSFDGWI